MTITPQSAVGLFLLIAALVIAAWAVFEFAPDVRHPAPTVTPTPVVTPPPPSPLAVVAGVPPWADGTGPFAAIRASLAGERP